MKFLRYCAILIIVGLYSCAALANGIDPGVRLGGTGSSGSFTQTQCLFRDAICTLTLDSTGSGIADILNNTGFNIVSDTVNIDSSFDPPLFCDPSNPFGFNNITGGGTSSFCTFAFSSDPQGIPGGSSYGIHVSNFTLSGTPLSILRFDLFWINGTTPTPVPEPGTMLLLGTGLVTLAAGRKRLKGANQLV